jgi:hypothetical protein
MKHSRRLTSAVAALAFNGRLTLFHLETRMNKKLLALCALALAAPAFAADVGVSVSISQPGVYGRIDIGRFPQPQVVVAQPVIIQRPVVVHQPQPQVVVVQPEPVYMWVPPGHRKNWRKHCRHYNACGVPVYFVQDQWYDKNVRHNGRDRDDGPGRGHGRGHDKRD